MDKPPNSKVNLDRAIQRIYGTGAKYVEIRSMIANTVVGQFLPEGVVKGGSALRFRYGLENTRVTVDFDTAHRRRQVWPPSIAKGDNWDTLYADARGNLDVLASVDAAIEWVNALVKQIADS